MPTRAYPLRRRTRTEPTASPNGAEVVCIGSGRVGRLGLPPGGQLSGRGLPGHCSPHKAPEPEAERPEAGGSAQSRAKPRHSPGTAKPRPRPAAGVGAPSNSSRVGQIAVLRGAAGGATHSMPSLSPDRRPFLFSF